jgi:hypothetical protein
LKKVEKKHTADKKKGVDMRKTRERYFGTEQVGVGAGL